MSKALELKRESRYYASAFYDTAQCTHSFENGFPRLQTRPSAIPLKTERRNDITPAMAAGVTEEPWTIAEIVNLLT